MLALLAVFSCMLLTGGCSKKIECGNAEVCMVNTTTDTIYYCWGCSGFSDTLLPGEKSCTSLTTIELEEEAGGTWTDFNTSTGNYRIQVDECRSEYKLQ